MSIKDNNYYKKQERQKNDIDLELWYNVCVNLCWIKVQIVICEGDLDNEEESN